MLVYFFLLLARFLPTPFLFFCTPQLPSMYASGVLIEGPLFLMAETRALELFVR